MSSARISVARTANLAQSAAESNSRGSQFAGLGAPSVGHVAANGVNGAVGRPAGVGCGRQFDGCGKALGLVADALCGLCSVELGEGDESGVDARCLSLWRVLPHRPGSDCERADEQRRGDLELGIHST